VIRTKKRIVVTLNDPAAQLNMKLYAGKMSAFNGTITIDIVEIILACPVWHFSGLGIGNYIE
jgi:hypothetical protein